MIAEKPSWIRHQDLPIFSVDIQSGGRRFATGGGDHMVRIWTLRSVQVASRTDDPSSQRLLATLTDHFGSVNCVRWADHGHYLASGSDDQVILIYERKPGSGTIEFGNAEPTDVENWKVHRTLKGHTGQVVDLNWSPDDMVIASASLDNTVRIWNISSGTCTAVLRGHSSFVRGVAWDPLGSFMASQSDDKSVIIWQTSDWSLVRRTKGHWRKSLGSAFFRRLAWSPCGSLIATTRGFQKPKHSAPVLERDEWNVTFDFLGHNAPITVVKFNNSLFRQHHSSIEGGKDSKPYNVIAIGSEDRSFSVWTTASLHPVCLAKHFFAQSVVDLSWSSDGYSLFACSLDGTVATYHFDEKEIGRKINYFELVNLRKCRYGKMSRWLANLAETPAQSLLQEISAKKSSIKKEEIDARPEKSARKTTAPRVDNVRKGEGVGAKIPARIIPEAIGAPRQQNAPRDTIVTRMTEASQRAIDGDSLVVQKADNSESVAGSNCAIAVKVTEKKEGGDTAVTRMTEASQRAIDGDSLVVEKADDSGSAAGSNCAVAVRVIEKEGGDIEPICLEARLSEPGFRDIVGLASACLMKETDIICTQGLKTLWSDRISGEVCALAGNGNFWAVGCEDGCLQVYTKWGRRALPMMMIGSKAMFVDCDEGWKLMLVTKWGSLYVWDFSHKTRLLHDTLASLVTSNTSLFSKETVTSIKVLSAKLTKSGSPLVVLATGQAFLFDMGFKCWLRVANHCFPASNLAKIQADVRKLQGKKPVSTSVIDEGTKTRAQLESQVMTALAYDSPDDYRRYLLLFVQFLTREADESRLREVCESFLGPPPAGMAEASSSQPEDLKWTPFLLGMEKRELLRVDILPSMASNVKLHRLMKEFSDRLSEYQTPKPRADQKDAAAETSGDEALKWQGNLPNPTSRVLEVILALPVQLRDCSRSLV